MKQGKRVTGRLLAVCLILLLASVPAQAGAVAVHTWTPQGETPAPSVQPSAAPAQAATAPADPAASAQSVWPPQAATLNQRMATRSGPSTLYTEELGTLPQSTAIAVLWQEMGSVPWALVEYERGGMLYRAYTGMKRINTGAEIPWVEEDPIPAYILENVTPLYGPGDGYAAHSYTLAAGLLVEVRSADRGYVLIDYAMPDNSGLRARAWISASQVEQFHKK